MKIGAAPAVCAFRERLRDLWVEALEVRDRGVRLVVGEEPVELLVQERPELPCVVRSGWLCGMTRDWICTVRVNNQRERSQFARMRSSCSRPRCSSGLPVASLISIRGWVLRDTACGVVGVDAKPLNTSATAANVMMVLSFLTRP